jgi:hypothetical protein
MTRKQQLTVRLKKLETRAQSKLAKAADGLWVGAKNLAFMATEIRKLAKTVGLERYVDEQIARYIGEHGDKGLNNSLWNAVERMKNLQDLMLEAKKGTKDADQLLRFLK